MLLAVSRIASQTVARSFCLATALAGSVSAQDLSTVNVSGEWDVSLTASFAPNTAGITKGSGKGKIYMTQAGSLITGVVVDKLGKCQSFELPLNGLREDNGFTASASGPTIDLITCAGIGNADTLFLATLTTGAAGTATGSGSALAYDIPLTYTSVSTLKRVSGLQTPTDPDGFGPGVNLDLIGKLGLGVGGVHDLAVYKVTIPKSVKAKAGPVTKKLKVQIQNRSQHSEVIEDAAMLAGVVELTAEVDSGLVDAPTITLVAPKESKFPIVLKPRAKYTAVFTAEFAGPADPMDPGETGTISYTARVHHEALAGNIADGHSFDDVAPRSVIAPYTFDTFPDGSIKEKGVGAKKSDKTSGDPLLTALTVGVP